MHFPSPPNLKPKRVRKEQKKEENKITEYKVT
jgi:hypothetical protein